MHARTRGARPARPRRRSCRRVMRFRRPSSSEGTAVAPDERCWSVCFPRMTHSPIEPPAANASWLAGTGDVRLYASAPWPDVTPIGVLYFVLGPEIGSAEPYPRFTSAARASGFVTATVHPRGSGYSDGTRGDIDDYARILADLELGMAWARQLRPTAPLFLFGHSVGAALALALAARSPRVAGLVLVNPAYRLLRSRGMAPSWTDYVAYAWNYVVRPSALTVDMNRAPSDVRDPSDRAEAEAMQRDPLVVRYFSLRYLLAQKRVMNRCPANARATRAPLLLVQGARDALVDPRGHDDILAAAGTTDTTRLIARDGAHGATAVETVADDILAWLEGRARRS